MFAAKVENPNYRQFIGSVKTIALPVRFRLYHMRYGDHILYIGDRSMERFETDAADFNAIRVQRGETDDWMDVELKQTIGDNNVIHIKRGVVNYYAKRLELAYREKYGHWPKPVYYRNQLEEAQRRRLL